MCFNARNDKISLILLWYAGSKTLKKLLTLAYWNPRVLSKLQIEQTTFTSRYLVYLH